MGILFYITMTLTGFCGLGLVAAAIFSHNSRVTSKRVLMVLHGFQKNGSEVRKKHNVQKKVFAATHWLRARLGMSINSQLAERFERAAIPNPAYQELYLAARIMGPIFAVIAGSFSPWNRQLVMIGLAGGAYLAPDILLQRITAKRKERIRLSVPDAVDLLVICVDAGLGMDQAMLRVAQELGKRHPDLQGEFLRINREQKAGKLRLEAWQSMADRNQLAELDGFVNMLAQTERFGTPIARALSNFGEGIRQKRRQRAEELAAKTTVKIIFPLVLCIFPSLFIVLLGPPGIKVAQGIIGFP